MESLSADQLYTFESVIFSNRLQKVNTDEPIFYGKDGNGNIYVCDGNHRAYRAFCEEQCLVGEQVAFFEGDITNNQDCRLVSELKVVD